MAKLLITAATYGYTLLVIIASLGKFVLGVFPKNVQHSDKIGHFIAYAGFAFIWSLFLYKVKKIRFNKSIGLGFLWSVFFGILMEFCQSMFTSYRQFDYLDMGANTLGSILGLLIFYFFLVFMKKRQH